MNQNQFEKELIETLEILANIPIEILVTKGTILCDAPSGTKISLIVNDSWKQFITVGDIKKARKIIKILKSETKNREKK